MSLDLYKFAAQHALRFDSIKGALTVEQLFDLPLTSNSGFNLDTVAKGVNAALKAGQEESFVSTNTNPQQKVYEVALEIVKDVIATKLAANAAELARQHRTEERRRLLDALAAKKDQQLSQASVEELEAQLAALDD
jgi:thiamine biosynthesis protein ThiC